MEVSNYGILNVNIFKVIAEIKAHYVFFTMFSTLAS